MNDKADETSLVQKLLGMLLADSFLCPNENRWARLVLNYLTLEKVNLRQIVTKEDVSSLKRSMLARLEAESMSVGQSAWYTCAFKFMALHHQSAAPDIRAQDYLKRTTAAARRPTSLRGDDEPEELDVS